MEGEEINWGRHGFMMRVEWLSAQNHVSYIYACVPSQIMQLCTKTAYPARNLI